MFVSYVWTCVYVPNISMCPHTGAVRRWLFDEIVMVLFYPVSMLWLGG